MPVASSIRCLARSRTAGDCGGRQTMGEGRERLGDQLRLRFRAGALSTARGMTFMAVS